MDIEFEAKWIEFSENLRETLTQNGFKNTKPKTLYRRNVFIFPKTNTDKALRKWARVRDEGDCITMTIKEIVNDGIDGVLESEVKINSYENGISFLKAAGLKSVSYQETTREIWKKDDIEVVFDQWPGLPIFIEIEAPNEVEIRKIASILKLDFNKAYFGAVEKICEDVLGISMKELNSLPEITFENPLRKKDKK